MQNLNTRKVANDWTDDKAVSIFESLLAEDKKAYKWWYKDLKTTELTMDRKDWVAVRKAFKERWPPLLEPEEDLESKTRRVGTNKINRQRSWHKSDIPRAGALLPCCICKPSNP